MRTSHLIAAAACAGIAKAATPEEWRSRSIYFMLTDRFARSDNSTDAECNTEDRMYCGGNYQGIISQLDYIQGMGFDSIWITPVTKQIEGETGYGEAYHGYWQTDIYGTNDNFGTADDLKALSTALHDRDMFLMVDVVVNHNVWNGDGSSVDYSIFNPFNSEENYHPYCLIEDYEDQTQVEECWLGDSTLPLPDLNTSDEGVAAEYDSWISGLVSNYSVDGIRIDTVKHVDKEFFPSFNAAAGVYCIGEVLDGDPNYTSDYQNYLDGVLNYPTYYPLIEAFKSTSGSLSDLANGISTAQSSFKDVGLLGSFSEGHDIPRFASYTGDLSLAKNVLAFTILADGIPIIYAGQEHQYAGAEDPANREATWLSGFNTEAPLYQHLSKLNKVRSVVGDPTAANTVISSDNGVLALRKGDIVSVLTNAGVNGAGSTVTISSGYDAGEVTDVLTCETATVDGSGSLAVKMNQGQPRVYAPSSAIADSGLC